MKVGDLVKIRVEHRMPQRLLANATYLDGQLGVLIEENGLAAIARWKVMLMSGELFWIEPRELEVQE